MGATIYAFVAAAIIVFTTQVQWGEKLDARAVTSMGSHARWWMHHIDGVTVPLMCVMGLVATVGAVIQVMRGRQDLAFRAVILVAGTQTSVEMLKRVIHREDGALNTTPSGHSSLAVALVLAVVSLWPTRFVRISAFAAAGFVAYGTVIGGWHTPGDVVAACAIVGFWSSLTSGGVRNRRPDLTCALSIGVGMLVASAGLHPGQVHLAPAALSFIAVWLSLFLPLQRNLAGITDMRKERE